MINLIRIEALKLRTSPALPVTAALTVALSIIAAVTSTLMGGRHGTPAVGSAANVTKAVTQPVAVGATAMLVLGILAIAGDYRHRTIQATFLAERQPWRVLVAKLMTIAIVGAGLEAATFGAVLAVDLPVYATKGMHDLPIDFTTYWSGAVLSGACFGMLGVALGTVTRNAVAAIIAGIVWTQLIERHCCRAAPRRWASGCPPKLLSRSHLVPERHNCWPRWQRRPC